MQRGPLAILVLLAVVAGAAAQATEGESVAKPERTVTCWDCHQTVQGNAPPIKTFVNFIPPVQAGSDELHEPFDYIVQVQNAWSSEFRATRVGLDLTGAPSLAFASDIPDLVKRLPGSIPFDPAAATQPRQAAVTQEIPFGHTELQVQLIPGDADEVTGPDLALLIYPGKGSAEGDPISVDAQRRGGTETFVADRALLEQHGAGNWTFAAQARLLPDDPSLGPAAPLGTSVPFEIDLAAHAKPITERVAAVASNALVPAGGAIQLPFRLVGVAEPAAGESVALKADVWAHYTHKTNGPDDDANATKQHPVALPVVDGGGFPVLQADLTPSTTVALSVHNGPSLATVSEAVGYATTFLMLGSIASGGMFGKASRRQLNVLFGTARRRVAFHNFLSYGLILAAGVHLALFLVEAAYHWTLGLIWGGLALVALLGLGVTGAIQVPLVRAWSYAGWRWTHYGLAAASLLFSLAHLLLDGVHFADIQQAVGWSNPLEPTPV